MTGPHPPNREAGAYPNVLLLLGRAGTRRDLAGDPRGVTRQPTCVETLQMESPNGRLTAAC